MRRHVGYDGYGSRKGNCVIKMCRGCSAMSERHKRIHEVNTVSEGETEDQTLSRSNLTH